MNPPSVTAEPRDPRTPDAEVARLSALDELDILDTLPERDYDDLVRLATAICGTPVGLVSLVDRDRQWFKAKVGLDASQTPLDVSFCRHAIAQADLNAVFEVPDATADPRFADNVLVTGDPHLRFYAGVPLVLSDGHAVGSMCVIDRRPNRLTDGQRTALQTLARSVVARLELSRQNRRLRDQAAALAERELRFRSILDNSTPVIFAMDRDGRILFHNRRFAAPHGGADLVGRVAYDLLPPATADQFRAKNRQLWETGRPEVLERSMCVNGRHFHQLSNLFPLTNADGRMTALCVIATDITAQKAAEAELRAAKEAADQARAAAERLGGEAEAARAELDRQNQQLRAQAVALAEAERRLRAIMDHSRAMIFAKDRQGRMLFANREAALRFRRPEVELIGKTGHELMPAAMADLVMQHDARVWETRRTEVYDVRVNVSGGEHHMVGSLFPLTDAAGEMTALCAVLTDISEQAAVAAALEVAKKSAERLGAAAEAARAEAEAAREQAVAASAAKSDFLANMSHEIRTPLNGVVGMLQLLAGTPLDERQRRYAGIADASARALLTLINDILDLSKVEAGKLELDPVPFDLAEVAEQSAAVLAVRAEAKGLALACRVDPGLARRRVGPADRVRQVLLNLLGNAVKFTATGSVTLRVTAVDGDVVRFAVVDTGIGIPPDRLDRLFKSFSQVDAGTTRKYGGTGLGLAISKQLAELMGGTVGVDSTVGVGSMFWFTARLPADLGATDDLSAMCVDEPVEAVPAGGGTNGRRILVAEDNEVNQLVVGEMLRRLGHAVDLVDNGRSAVQAVAGSGGGYDLVLMDCQMPEMDGFEAAAALRAAGYRVPVVALTANALKGDRERCMAAGMDDYLTKPVDAGQLAAKLDLWLASGRRTA